MKEFKTSEELIKQANEPFSPPWDIHKEVVIYRDERYTLGQRAGRPYLIANGEEYILSCHPYEPCLYVTDKNGYMTAVHNAFDPFVVLEMLYAGKTVTSITGFEYDAKDFCRIVEYAAGGVDMQIDEAEKGAFGDRAKKKKDEPIKKEEKETNKSVNAKTPRPESGSIITDDPFYDLMEKYPDCVIDYCLVVNEDTRAQGSNSHRSALLLACRRLFVDDEDEAIWSFDVGKADARPISAYELFAPARNDGVLNYRKAFLYPPHTCGYTSADFDTVNSALFPKGTGELEVYEWTTDWSDYFDEGHEWWGALCLTVYDKRLDRFAVIMASATD